MNRDEWNRRMQEVEDATRDRPEDGNAWLTLADFLLDECDNPRLAIAAYDMAQAFLPDMDLRLHLGDAYFEAGELDRGIALMREHVDELPSAHGYCYLADAYMKCDRAVEARDALERGLRIEPEFEEIHFLMGELSRNANKPEAIRCYRRAITLDPNYTEAWLRLGSLLIGDRATLAEGIAALQRTISFDPDRALAHEYLAIGHWMMGNHAEAEQEYHRATELEPNNELFEDYLADYLATRPPDGHPEWPSISSSSNSLNHAILLNRRPFPLRSNPNALNAPRQGNRSPLSLTFARS
jgi:tetratricopeptide (TPR) repeat protein